MRGFAIAKVQFRGLMCCERMPAHNIKSTELFEYTEVNSPKHWESYQEKLDEANGRKAANEWSHYGRDPLRTGK